MSEPTCRTCYAATLTPDQRQQFSAELVTGTIYLCPEHRAAEDAFLAKYAGAFIQVDRPGELRFAAAPTQTQEDEKWADT